MLGPSALVQLLWGTSKPVRRTLPVGSCFTTHPVSGRRADLEEGGGAGVGGRAPVPRLRSPPCIKTVCFKSQVSLCLSGPSHGHSLVQSHFALAGLGPSFLCLKCVSVSSFTFWLSEVCWNFSYRGNSVRCWLKPTSRWCYTGMCRLESSSSLLLLCSWGGSGGPPGNRGFC